MKTVSEIVKGHTAHFQYFRAGNLIYKTTSDFEFPIPVSDTGEATFPAEEKAITFMRWIRKHHDLICKSNTSES